LVPAAQQPLLAKTYDEHDGQNGYDRGHQIASADRLMSSSVNATTYYYTNMTPQRTAFNGQAWAALEEDVRGWATEADEFYVVTGCVISDNPDKAHDNNGDEVSIPRYYYKALLRKKGGNWTACAFWFDHKNYPTTAQFNNNPGNWRISVRSLEEKAGVNFFPNLEGVVGKTEYDRIESTATAF
jgi:endonuclease G